MRFSITLGWWLWPMFVNVAAFGLAYLGVSQQDHATGLVGASVVAVLLYGLAMIFSLIAWLVWAVLS